jgi:hypothetical protein
MGTATSRAVSEYRVRRIADDWHVQAPSRVSLHVFGYRWETPVRRWETCYLRCDVNENPAYVRAQFMRERDAVRLMSLLQMDALSCRQVDDADDL